MAKRRSKWLADMTIHVSSRHDPKDHSEKGNAVDLFVRGQKGQLTYCTNICMTRRTARALAKFILEN